MTLQAPVAGPSRTPYRPHPLSSRFDPPSSSSRASTPSLYGSSSTPSVHGNGRSSTPSFYGRSSTPSFYGRSSTPILYPNGARFRSTSVLTTTEKEDEIKRKGHIDSVNKLKTAWELLSEKYGSINLEDDDEIDLITGEVIKDRGKLREFKGREFGEVSDPEEDDNEEEEERESSIFGNNGEYEFDSDEDEIGAWDERSGLDPQLSDPPLLEEEEDNSRFGGRKKSWISEEDQDDLREFLNLENMRNKLLGINPLNDDEISQSPELETPLNVEERERLISPRLRGTRILPAPRLEDLFLSDNDDEEEELSSEDELQVIGGDEDDEVVYIPPTANDDDPFLERPAAIPPKPRRRQTLEVVIPIRARRASLPSTSNVVKAPPIPHQPPQKPVQKSKSVPSLAELFNTPPPEDDLCSRSSSASSSRSPSPAPPSSATNALPRQPSPVHQAQHEIAYVPLPPPSAITSPSFTPQPKKLPASAKGKERMSGERPSESEPLPSGSTDSSYHLRLWKTRLGVVKSCKRCKKAGGIRAEKAPWCKGRKGPSECTFEQAIDRRRNGSSGNQVGGLKTSVPFEQSEKDLTVNNDITTMESEDECVGNISNSSTIRVAEEPESRTKIRKCSLCRTAGGERAEKADKCNGRATSKRCPYYLSNPDKNVEESEDDLPIARPKSSTSSRRSLPRQSTITDISDTDNSPIIRKTKNRSRQVLTKSDTESEQPQSRSRAITPAKTPVRAMSEYPGTTPERPTTLDSDLYCINLTFRPNGRPRRCGLCMDAGAIRAERAYWCKGRAWAKFCGFSKDYYSASPEKETIEVETTSMISLDAKKKTPEVIPGRASSVTRTKRKRVVSSTMASDLPTSPTPNLSQNNSSHMPSPPPTSSAEPYSPIQPSTFHINRPSSIASSTSYSMPPSSPPVFTPTNRPIHPTPSPSLSAGPINESPIIHKAQSLHSIPRGVTIGFGPTPSPSIDGARSSSILSDNIPLTLPRKSILRKTSGSSCPSSNGSVKRARFSLQPRSPIRMESSDPLNQDLDNEGSSEDELSIGNIHHNHRKEYSLPYPNDNNSSPTFFDRYSISTSTSSSSPLRNQWSVRAADVGIKLGPEHTGTLPKGMIKALTPSLCSTNIGSTANTKHTLGSAINDNFNLPTPPPSFGSSSSSTNTVRRNESINSDSPAGESGIGNQRKSTNIGLMLPPPVPPKRLTPAPSSSPLIPASNISRSTSTTRITERSTSITPSLNTTEKKTNSSPIKSKSHPSPYKSNLPKSRSRSRSMSLQPSSFNTPMMKRGISREISTTPRRKSKVELELEKKANELGDDAGLEWGLDEDTEDGGRMWREGSVVMFTSEL